MGVCVLYKCKYILWIISLNNVKCSSPLRPQPCFVRSPMHIWCENCTRQYILLLVNKIVHNAHLYINKGE